MQLQYIREFVVLAKYGNYLAASEELFISQSSLSKHIMMLEKELGAPVFNRTTRKVQLTQLGKTFLPYAQRITETEQEFQDVLSDARKDSKTNIRLGVLPAFRAYGMGEVISEYMRRFPSSSLSVTEGDNSNMFRYLKDGNCNIILARTFDASFPSSFATIPLLKDCISLFVLKNSPLGKRKSISWKELETLNLISSTSQLQADILTSFSKENHIQLSILFQLSRADSIIEMLKKGVADGALLQRIVSEYRQDDETVIIDIEPPIRDTVALVYKKDRPLTPALKNFIEIAKSHMTREEYADGRA